MPIGSRHEILFNCGRVRTLIDYVFVWFLHKNFLSEMCVLVFNSNNLFEQHLVKSIAAKYYIVNHKKK